LELLLTGFFSRRKAEEGVGDVAQALQFKPQYHHKNKNKKNLEKVFQKYVSN
jgi:hypothetical protein